MCRNILTLRQVFSVMKAEFYSIIAGILSTISRLFQYYCLLFCYRTRLMLYVQDARYIPHEADAQPRHDKSP
jgi:hypothetical protein